MSKVKLFKYKGATRIEITVPKRSWEMMQNKGEWQEEIELKMPEIPTDVKTVIEANKDIVINDTPIIKPEQEEVYGAVELPEKKVRKKSCKRK